MPYTIYYHGACKGFWGRAFTPLAMLNSAGKDFEIKGSDEVPAGSGFAPPFCGFPGGYTISQTAIISEMVGRQCGYAPSDEGEDAKAKQYFQDVSDLMTDMFKGDPERIMKWVNYFDGQVKDNGYLLSFGLSYADFGLFSVLKAIMDKKAVGKLESVSFPAKLQQLYDKVAANEGVKKLLESGTPMLPPTML